MKKIVFLTGAGISAESGIPTFRGQEIQQWLDKHKCDKYVILDDDLDFFDSQLPYFVHTDWEVGLTENDVNKAINILNYHD